VENWRNNYTYSWAAQRTRERRARIGDVLAMLACYAMAAGFATVIVLVLAK